MYAPVGGARGHPLILATRGRDASALNGKMRKMLKMTGQGRREGTAHGNCLPKCLTRGCEFNRIMTKLKKSGQSAKVCSQALVRRTEQNQDDERFYWAGCRKG
jgi:hypothetical protein